MTTETDERTENVGSAPSPRRTLLWSLQWMRENLEAIALAFIMALLIKCFFVDLYQIPSSSMEPTIMGSENNGDRILVNKFYYEVSDIERFDVVVFKFPLKHTKNFIKRVVGLPDEDLIVSNGDIYFRRHDDKDGKFKIARKPFRIQESLWIDIAGGDYCNDDKAFSQFWKQRKDDREKPANVECRDGKLSIALPGGAAGVGDFLYTQRISDGKNDNVVINDRKISFAFEIVDGEGSVFAEFETPHGTFRADVHAGGRGALRVNGASGRDIVVPIEASVRRDKQNMFALMTFDGSVHVSLNGDVVAHYEHIDTLQPLNSSISQRDAVRFGAENLSCLIDDLRVWRDLHYIGKDAVREGSHVSIDPGMYLMMGDNVNNSHDSRSWLRKTFVLKDGRRIVCDNNEYQRHPLRHDHVKPVKSCETCREQWRRSADCPICRANAGGQAPEHAYIAGDIQGRVHAFTADEVHSEVGEYAPFVTEDLVMGKAFYVIWPRGRWFRLIR